MESCVNGINSCQISAGAGQKNMEETKMKKNKMYSLPIIATVMLLFLVGIVNAGTCTITAPAASAVIKGTSNMMNITLTDAVTDNCTILATSALSGQSFTVGTAKLNTTNQTVNFNYTSMLNEGDASDWVYSVTCINSTGTTDTCSRTGLSLDYTVPVIKTCTVDGSTAANGSVGGSDITFACTVYNATSCSAYWKTSTALAFTTAVVTRSDMELAAFTSTDAYGASGEAATAYLKQAEDNAKNVYIACTDGKNTTTGTTYALSMSGYSPAQEQIHKTNIQGTVYTIQHTETQNKKVVFFIIIGIAALFILIAAFAMSKKK